MSKVLLIGAGPMAAAYVKALRHIRPATELLVMGRGAESAARFFDQTGIRAGVGELADQLKALRDVPASAIVAVSVSELANTAQQLLDFGVGKVLLEKPGAVTVDAAKRLAAADTGDRIHVAYNRRFLPSTHYVRDALTTDGGATSVTFEFSEPADRIGASSHPLLVKNNWVLANSSHVIDMAFYLAGAADDLSDVTIKAAVGQGHLAWHPSGARFAGAGTVGHSAVFSYSADWETGGGWGVEVASSARKYILRPLETVHAQERGMFVRNALDIPDEEGGLKPGLPGMLRYFLDGDASRGTLPTASQQARRLAVYEAMLG